MAHNGWPAGQPASAWVSNRDHQEPPAAVLRPGRTQHPLGTPLFPSAWRGNPVQSRLGCEPSDPSLTASTAAQRPLKLASSRFARCPAGISRHGASRRRKIGAGGSRIYPNGTPHLPPCSSSYGSAIRLRCSPGHYRHRLSKRGRHRAGASTASLSPN